MTLLRRSDSSLIERSAFVIGRSSTWRSTANSKVVTLYNSRLVTWSVDQKSGREQRSPSARQEGLLSSRSHQIRERAYLHGSSIFQRLHLQSYYPVKPSMQAHFFRIPEWQTRSKLHNVFKLQFYWQKWMVLSS